MPRPDRAGGVERRHRCLACVTAQHCRAFLAPAAEALDNLRGSWPTVNQLVELNTTGSPAWLPSRVEDRDDRPLVVAAPCDPSGHVLVAEPGHSVYVRWVEKRGLRRLDTTVTGGQDGRVPLWELWTDRVPVLHQRLRYARVRHHLSGRVQESRESPYLPLCG